MSSGSGRVSGADGVILHLLGQGSTGEPGDHNGDRDGGGQPDPFSNANFYNFTIAGSDMRNTFLGHTNNNDGWEMRNGFAGSANNGVIYNTGGRQGIDLAGGGTTNFTTADNAAAGLISVAQVVCDDVTGIPAAPSPEPPHATSRALGHPWRTRRSRDPTSRIVARTYTH